MAASSKPDRASDSPAHVSQNAPASKSASTNVWGLLERVPGFNERVAKGRAQLKAGQKVEFEPDDQPR
jgi:hypothetical protein